ncbi:MAG: DUF4113 domain-containing protein [Chthoniobacter sp.]|nr:DUF4113 domain-containing protein [Chthoniobacter sp.]
MGIILLDLASHVPAQRSLFLPEIRFAEKARLQAAIDHLNLQFGRDTVRTRQGFANRHHLRAEKRSRCFTTRWEELLQI